MSEMIDRLIAEGAMPAVAAAKILTAALRAGRPVHPGTVTRWITIGVTVPGGRRVRLEGMRAGRKWLTSRPAITRFLAAQQPTEQESPAVRSPAERQRATDNARRELKAAGGI